MDQQASTLPTIGFVLVSHDREDRVLRAIEGLNKNFDNPPIACHHDSYQSRIDRNSFPPNVRFPARVHRTGWGKWGVTAGTLDALSLLYEDGGPDWFFVASAACYPIKRGDQIRAELARSEADALIDFHSVDAEAGPQARLIGTPNPTLDQFESPANREMKRRFAKSPQFWIPIIRRKPHLRIGRWTWRPPWEGRHPYDDQMPLFYGDFWFAANRKAAHHLLGPTPRREALMRQLKHRPMPEETFFQTWLATNPDLTIDIDNRRWAEWLGGGAHPQWMTSEYLEAAFRSNAFFARKFSAGSPLMDEIDRRLASDSARG